MVQGPACSYIQKFFTDTCHQSDHHYQTFKSLYKVLLSAVGILLLPYHQSVHIILLSITISSFSIMSSFQHPGCLSLTQKSKIQKHLPCCSFCSYCSCCFCCSCCLPLSLSTSCILALSILLYTEHFTSIVVAQALLNQNSLCSAWNTSLEQGLDLPTIVS